MFKRLMTTITGDPSERELRRIRPIVDEVNDLEPEMQGLSDEALRAKTEEFRGRLEEGETLEDLLPEAFAVVREASVRSIGLRHYDVQIIGGVVLHRGLVGEMKTGEGKTLVASLPLYLNALTGKGCHLVTPNDYLSKVGVQTIGPIYAFLGMSVGVIQNMGTNPQMASFLYDADYQAADDRYQHLRPVARRECYRADITYGTNNEFGFDYLRDNMVWSTDQKTQRELHYSIVDEVDNILIDEARTPLIISGPAEEATDWYGRFAEMVARLEPEVDEAHPGDFKIDLKMKNVTPTDEGIEKVEQMLGIDNLYSAEHYELTPYFENALKARALFEKDKEYIVSDEGEVIIVDEFTGRLMPGRRFSEGLHQAIEAKENVRVQRESLTLATITFQNLFRMYDKLAGMTGTALTEMEELHLIYGLDVVAIPTHRPVVRLDQPDLVYIEEGAKWRNVVQEIADRHDEGQPVLVGTVAVETSETLHKRLQRKGVPHEVLNAKNHEREAEIIAQAGRIGSVTIATNMAGRGVDILLGGNPEGIARAALRKKGVDLTELSSLDWDDAVHMLREGEDPSTRHEGGWVVALSEAWHLTAAEKEKVLELGGLYVVGTERHEARRIDNQLRGRSGRQGDPGESRFFVSLEDDLMIRFGGERVKGLMDRLNVDPDLPIESGMVSKQIEGAQVKVEGFNFDTRKHLLEYDEVINQQRTVIYDQRDEVLRREDLRPVIWSLLEEEVGALVATYTASEEPEEWDIESLGTQVGTLFELPEEEEVADWGEWEPEEIREHVLAIADEIYTAKVARVEEEFGEGTMLQLERAVLLRAIDQAWIRHLTALDELRAGIGLRALAQEKPITVFKREGFQMFQSLLAVIGENAVRGVFLAEPAVQEQQARRPRAMDKAVAGRGDLLRQAQKAGAARKPQTVRVGPKLSRNAPCWCGSGKKYKQCHLREDAKSGGPPAPAGAQRG